MNTAFVVEGCLKGDAPDALSASAPLVSVVMPTYNREAFIGEAIASVLSQTYAKWELLIADDGSTDGTAERVRGLCDARIKFLAGPHVGSAAAMRNRALAHAQGALLAFLDSDDLWKPEKLEAQVRYFCARPAVDFLHTSTEVFDETGLVEIRPRDKAAPQGQVFWKLALGNFISSNTVMVRASVVQSIGLQNERPGISEDYEHWLRMAEKHVFGFLPEVTASYRRHSGNMSANVLREAVRGQEAVRSVLLQVKTPRWRRLFATLVSRVRVLAIAAEDRQIDDQAFLELLVQRRHAFLLPLLAPLLRAVLRLLLSHRVAIERVANRLIANRSAHTP